MLDDSIALNTGGPVAVCRRWEGNMLERLTRPPGCVKRFVLSLCILGSANSASTQVFAQSANTRSAASGVASQAVWLCSEGEVICVSRSLEDSLISNPMDVTVVVNTDDQIEVTLEIADSTGLVLESTSTNDDHSLFCRDSQIPKTLRIRDYLLQPAKSTTGTMTLTPIHYDPSSGKTGLPGLTIPIHLNTTTSFVTILLPANNDDFNAEEAVWFGKLERRGEFSPKATLVKHTVTVMKVDPSHIVGATAAAAARAWPGQGPWHVIDSHLDGDTAHITITGDAWAGITYYLDELDFIITKSLLGIHGVKRVRI